LRDQTSINSLPDHILRKVLNYLDIRSLCRSSQVCQRWRYLCQDGSIWKKRLRMIGLSEGIVNLPRKIETLAKNQHVDWKQAYLEVRNFYNKGMTTTLVEQQGVPTDKEIKDEKIGEPLLLFSSAPPQQTIQRLQQTPDKPDSPSGHELVDILIVKTMNNIGPVQTPTTADQLQRKAEFESKAEDQNDLTGGNLKMLAKSLRLLLKQKDEPEEEVALDIRPALVQASNLLVWDIVHFNRLQVLYGHRGCVSCLQFDDRLLVSGSHDKTIRVWDTSSWECIRVIQAHQGTVTCLEFDGKHILSGSVDRLLKLWDACTGQMIRVFSGHEEPVASLK
ncbi:putative E3 ubiquitin ligase complex SCF subunit sconB, partial [Exaiptasia diaphana]